MNDIPDYIVTFGKVAWTVNYEDKLGVFTFTFECDTDEYKATGKANKLFLSKTPLKDKKLLDCQTQEETNHLELMIERVRGYLASRGYKVDLV
jgi:hypothetical protein